MRCDKKYCHRLLILALVLATSLVLDSCQKIDTPPMLELTVVNSQGNAIEGVMVGLFDDLDEWSKLENPVQPWRETDSEGKVLFIDLREEIYFFYADGDSISNIGGRIQLVEPLLVNEKRQISITIE